MTGYQLPIRDSMRYDDVPHGAIRGPYTLPSKVYPGTQHTYWIYVPAQYDPAIPAALMVYQDGQAFKDENGDLYLEVELAPHRLYRADGRDL